MSDNDSAAIETIHALVMKSIEGPARIAAGRLRFNAALSIATRIAG